MAQIKEHGVFKDYGKAKKKEIQSVMLPLDTSVEKPLFMIGLISFCADQFSSVCSPMQRLLLYMYLSQLMSTFTNYLKVHRSLDGYFIQ